MFQCWLIFVYLSFVLLLPARVFSQIGKLSGYVLDHYSEKPLPGTNIVIKEKNIGIAADNNGFFILNQVPVGKNVVEISRIGYGSLIQEVEIKNGQTATLNFRLKAVAIKFSEVLVTATRGNALQNEVTVAAEVSRLLSILMVGCGKRPWLLITRSKTRRLKTGRLKTGRCCSLETLR